MWHVCGTALVSLKASLVASLTALLVVTSRCCARGRMAGGEEGMSLKQQIEELSEAEVEVEDGVCPACEQRFGSQDKDWHSSSSKKNSWLLALAAYYTTS